MVSSGKIGQASLYPSHYWREHIAKLTTMLSAEMPDKWTKSECQNVIWKVNNEDSTQQRLTNHNVSCREVWQSELRQSAGTIYFLLPKLFNVHVLCGSACVGSEKIGQGNLYPSPLFTIDSGSVTSVADLRGLYSRKKYLTYRGIWFQDISIVDIQLGHICTARCGRNVCWKGLYLHTQFRGLFLCIMHMLCHGNRTPL